MKLKQTLLTVCGRLEGKVARMPYQGADTWAGGAGPQSGIPM